MAGDKWATPVLVAWMRRLHRPRSRRATKKSFAGVVKPCLATIVVLSFAASPAPTAGSARAAASPHPAAGTLATGTLTTGTLTTDGDEPLAELFAPVLDESTGIINIAASFAAGFDGTGQTVAIIDTGVDTSHPFVAGRVIREACFTDNACPDGTGTQIGGGAAPPCLWGSGCGHGTHVAGIIAGRSAVMSGVAPGANIIAIQVFSRVDETIECAGEIPCARARADDVLRALEYVYSLRNEVQISAVNLSLSSDDARLVGCDESQMKSPIDRLRAAGIATIVSSGNGGAKDGLGLPACISSTISVGATNGVSDTVWPDSNSAPALDFLAPGVAVSSAIPGDQFASATGTSAAAPHVAGAWALSAQRLGTRDVATIADHLRRTGVPIADSNGVITPRIALGLPFIDVLTGDFYYAAVTYLLDNSITTGLNATEFGPASGVTRAQTATFLHRMLGSPAGNPSPGYGDVPGGVFYTEPVAWLKVQGITNLPAGSSFAPNRTVTRGEMAAFLHRLAGTPAPLSRQPFTDVPPSAFYEDAVQWLRETGVTVGIGGNAFGPNQPVTRGQMAAFLHRLHGATGIG